MNKKNTKESNMYSKGIYFKNKTRHSKDARFKVKPIMNFLKVYLEKYSLKVNSYADVGCGSGQFAELFVNELKIIFSSIKTFKAFDVSPHVNELSSKNLDFQFGDFTETNEHFDLVTLIDVFEHVINPSEFLKKISKRTNFIILHIPLEDCMSVNFRTLQKRKINNPGHLLYLNINSAINLITSSNFKIIDFEYSTEAIKAPSNNESILQKIFFPIKFIVFKSNKYLYSKIFGNSLIVFARSNG